jgi:predicted metal-dependent hydrolase
MRSPINTRNVPEDYRDLFVLAVQKYNRATAWKIIAKVKMWVRVRETLSERHAIELASTILWAYHRGVTMRRYSLGGVLEWQGLLSQDCWALADMVVYDMIDIHEEWMDRYEYRSDVSDRLSKARYFRTEEGSLKKYTRPRCRRAVFSLDD